MATVRRNVQATSALTTSSNFQMGTYPTHRIFLALLVSCMSWASHGTERIVSLDYCADQFALGLLDKREIVALSVDAEREFSYMRAEARGLPKVRANAENVLAYEPTVVIRSYGGGPNAKKFYENLGISVVQVGYTSSIDQVKKEIARLSAALSREDRGSELVEEMNTRLQAVTPIANKKSAMYITQGGVTSGQNTMIDEIIRAAGLKNFEQKSGWRDIPLEELTLAQPELIATAFYNQETQHHKFWSAARHPILRDHLSNSPRIALSDATTSCGGWFLLDAVEQLHDEAYP